MSWALSNRPPLFEQSDFIPARAYQVSQSPSRERSKFFSAEKTTIADWQIGIQRDERMARLAEGSAIREARVNNVPCIAWLRNPVRVNTSAYICIPSLQTG